MSAGMRLRLLSSVALILGSIVSYACSSSPEESTTPPEDTALPSDNGGSTPPAAPPASSEPSNGADPGPEGSSSGGGTSSGGTSSSGGSSSGGGKGDAGGGASSSSSGGPGGGGTKCAAGSVAEKEANDAPAAATTIPNATGSACGSLSKAGDVDYFTFTMPADTNYLGFGSAFSQQGVDFEVTVDGETFTVGATPAVKPGKKYVVKAFTTGKVPVDYRLDVEIKK